MNRCRRFECRRVLLPFLGFFNFKFILTTFFLYQKKIYIYKLCVSRPVLKPVKGDSAITKHLKASPSCISDQLQQTGFTVLAQARSRAHLDVLEALFISRLAPPLCSQKDYVRTLALF